MSPQRIHLVTKQSQRPGTRLACGEFIADIISDLRSNPPIHHWVIQRQDSAEVIQWGQESRLDEAEKVATAIIKDLARKATKATKKRGTTGQ